MKDTGRSYCRRQQQQNRTCLMQLVSSLPAGAAQGYLTLTLNTQKHLEKYQ